MEVLAKTQKMFRREKLSNAAVLRWSKTKAMIIAFYDIKSVIHHKLVHKNKPSRVLCARESTAKIKGKGQSSEISLFRHVEAD